MKKIITSALVVMATTLGFSQKVTYGVKGGLNISSFSLETSKSNYELADTNSRIGFHIGGLAEIPFSDKFSYQVEVLYVQNGTKYTSNEYTKKASFDYNRGIMVIQDIPTGNTEKGEIKLHQVNTTHLLKYEVASNFKINGGLYLGALLGGAEKYDGESWESYDKDFYDSYKSLDYGFIIGAEYNFPNKIFVDARYNLGLANISNTNGVEQFNRSFQVGVGYKF